MEKEIEIYGKVVLEHNELINAKEDYKANIEYYKTFSEKPNNLKSYGIGVKKTHSDEIEVEIEQKEFNHIFQNEEEALKMLNLLMENKVTPVSLKDILEDFKLIAV